MKNQNNGSGRRSAAGARCVRALIMQVSSKTIFISLTHITYLQNGRPRVPYHFTSLPLGIKVEELTSASIRGDITFVVLNYN